MLPDQKPFDNLRDHRLTNRDQGAAISESISLISVPDPVEGDRNGRRIILYEISFVTVVTNTDAA